MRPYKKQPAVASVIQEASPKPLVELTEEDIEKLKSYVEVVLAVLRVATVFTMIALAPNALQALDIFERKKRGRKLSYKEKVQLTSQVFHYAKRQSYIELEPLGENDIKVIVKKKGKEKMIVIDRRRFLEIPKADKWDGKFWVIAADIPLKHKNRADVFRERVKDLGPFFLQKTMWFYPYDPSAEVGFLARECEVDRYVTFMKIEEMEPEDYRRLKDFFQKHGVI